MVMLRITHEEISATAGAATEEGRGPTLVAAPAVASPELTVTERPRRRHFDNKEKLRVLDEIDRAASTRGATGAIMRREGLYSSTITDLAAAARSWGVSGAKLGKAGPQANDAQPLGGRACPAEARQQAPSAAARSRRSGDRYSKKVALLIGFPIEDDEKL